MTTSPYRSLPSVDRLPADSCVVELASADAHEPVEGEVRQAVC